MNWNDGSEDYNKIWDLKKEVERLKAESKKKLESSYPKLIGLVGLAGAGKDLVASHLKMVGYTRFGFADALREEVGRSFTENYAIPCFPDHILADWLCCVCIGTEVLYEKPMYPAARRLLQWWGTEYRRAESPDYWIYKLQPKIMNTQNIVISDVRFLNEANWVEGWDGVIWRIERPGLKSDEHTSETQSNFIKADYTIRNDGDLQHLADRVLTALEVFREETQSGTA